MTKPCTNTKRKSRKAKSPGGLRLTDSAPKY